MRDRGVTFSPTKSLPFIAFQKSSHIRHLGPYGPRVHYRSPRVSAATDQIDLALSLAASWRKARVRVAHRFRWQRVHEHLDVLHHDRQARGSVDCAADPAVGSRLGSVSVVDKGEAAQIVARAAAACRRAEYHA